MELKKVVTTTSWPNSVSLRVFCNNKSWSVRGSQTSDGRMKVFFFSFTYKKIRRLVHFKHWLKSATQGFYMWSLVHLAHAGLLSWWNRYILSFVAIKVVFPRWNKPHVGLCNISIYYHYPDIRLYIFLDFGYSDIVTWQEGWLLLVFKAAFTVMWCDHPNITECFYNCSFIT